jgi:hypothetical protein
MTVIFIEVKSCYKKSGVCVGTILCCGSQEFLWLVVCTEHFLSVSSEHHNKSFHLWSVLVEEIPSAQCVRCQKEKPGYNIVSGWLHSFGSH